MGSGQFAPANAGASLAVSASHRVCTRRLCSPTPHDGPAGPEGHAAIMQAQERGETEVAPYFLHVPTRAEVERVRKRSHKSDAAAPALAEDD